MSLDGAARPRSPKAYEEVAELLLGRILGGQLASGDRLPNEVQLAEELGVSRTTIREALRLLAAQDLIRTSKGAGGGSYVTVPRVQHINQYLQSTIDVLTGAQHVTLEELLEARELLEVPAARLAAARRTEEDLERLRASLPDRPVAVKAEERFHRHREFHSVVLDTCGNTVLAIAAEPVFGVLMTRASHTPFGRAFNAAVHEQHREIAALIEAGDAEGAGDAMHAHLDFLRPAYEDAWRKARPGRR